MIVWNGKGIFTFFSIILGFLTLALLESMSISVANWGVVLGCIIAAGMNHLFLRVVPFSRENPARTYVDQQTGQLLRVSDEGSFFFIRRRYWTYILLGLSVFFLFYALL